jgi:dGTPase
MLTTEQIADTVPLFRAIADQVDTSYPGATHRIRFWEIERQIMNQMIGGLIEGTAQTVQELRVQDLTDVRNCPQRVAKLTPESFAVCRLLKNLLVSHVYENPDLKRMRAVAVDKVGILFDYLMTHPETIPEGYREVLEEEPQYRVVCDYIAGMTDSYFERRFDDLLIER